MLSGFIFRPIIWLRYSAFLIIYPIGIGCEIWLVIRAIQECNVAWLTAIMWGEVALYFPGMHQTKIILCIKFHP
jgi:hypothetical protein